MRGGVQRLRLSAFVGLMPAATRVLRAETANARRMQAIGQPR